MTEIEICTVDGCPKRKTVRGLCQMHYWRWRRTGTVAPRATRLDWLERRLTEPFADQCVYWPWGKNDHGYGHLTTNGRREYVHRVVWEKMRGPIPEGMVVRHKCRGASAGCFNPHHLEIGTQADNIYDMWRDGTAAVGDKQPHAKLTDELVREVRHRHSTECVSLAELARQYKVSPSTISRVVRRQGWRHVSELAS